MNHINVVGVSGSGKTTLANKIAGKFDLEHIELDALHWKEDWTSHDEEEFQKKINHFIDKHKDGWVIDGYYGNKQGDKPWDEADTIIYLDVPLWLVKLRIIRRSLKKKVKRELVWGTNKEKLRHQVSLQKSVNKWHPETRRQMMDFSQNVPKGTKYYHFRSNKEANSWLDSL